MYNIKALEAEWERYHRKRRRPWLIGSMLLILLVMGAIGYVQKEKIAKLIDTAESNQTIADSKDIGQKRVVPNYYIDTPLIKMAEKTSSTSLDSPIEDTPIEEQAPVTETAPVRKKLYIEVIDTHKKEAYKEVAKRFRLGHDPDDSLFLAKAYYAKKQYKKAEYWALQTNKVNDGIEESWLIFAKAKAKRGRKNEAKRILQTYIKKTNSSEAKVLLEKIKRGKI